MRVSEKAFTSGITSCVSTRLWVLLVVLMVGAWACKPQKPDVLEADRPELYKDTTEKEQVAKPKPPKKGVYYGYKTKKAFTKVVKNRKRTFELFHILPKYMEPNPYTVARVYWYHRKKRKIFIGPIGDKDKQYARLIHGPYRKVFDKKTVEEGIFYLGVKHGRWEQYTANDESILVDKSKWYKGFPKESEIAYYDVEQTQIKEVVPIVDGERHGEYFFYNEKGQVLTYGKFEHNRRIGIWLDYWDNSKKRNIKRKTQYPESAWVEQFEGYAFQELDANGKITWDKKAAEAKAKADEEAKKKAEEQEAKRKEMEDMMKQFNNPAPATTPAPTDGKKP